ncbi:MAG: cysteine--tRNA ligase [Nitrososphaerales archaeon]
MQIRDTLSMKNSEIPLQKIKEEKREFRMFVCGPTVQDNIHIGHAKTYFAFDILARWLLKRGTKIYFLMNITDVDDKIFDRAKRENSPFLQIADRFYTEFLEDLEALNIETVSKFARVSRYVEDSVELVSQMLESGNAYSLNQNVYFDSSKADHYGKLSHQSQFDLKMKSIDAAPGKKNSVDFLLWRHVGEAKEGIWQSKIGPGRPGWHIEDSGIAFKEFGGPYDLHGGATELIFPHHESELAQDEALSGQIPFVSIWMHTGLLMMKGEKMSKSLGNVVTIRAALSKFEADRLRIYFLRHHYRESFDYSEKELASCLEDLNRLKQASLLVPKSREPVSDGDPSLSKMESEFESSLDDDLQTPRAFKTLMNLALEIKERKSDAKYLKNASHTFWNFVEILGLRLS